MAKKYRVLRDVNVAIGSEITRFKEGEIVDLDPVLAEKHMPYFKAIATAKPKVKAKKKKADEKEAEE